MGQEKIKPVNDPASAEDSDEYGDELLKIADTMPDGPEKDRIIAEALESKALGANSPRKTKPN